VMFDRDGNPTDRSMLYTEYFVRGTEPTDYCPLHRGLDVLASTGDAQTGSAVTATSGTGTPQQSPTDTAKDGAHPAQNAPPAAVPAASAPDPSDSQTRKRGFWGRIFRR